MKKVVSFFKYLGLAVGLILLEQLPTVFLRKNQPTWQALIIMVSLLLVTLLTVYVAKRLGFLNHMEHLLTWDAWKSIFTGFLIMVPIKMLGGITLFLEHGAKTDTFNQSVIEQLGMSPLMLLVLTVIAAPIVEEFVFRGLIVKQAFKFSKLGVGVSTFLFGALHMPTDIGSWILYGGMGLVLALVYQKTQKLECSIALHAVNNFLGVISMFF